MIGKVLKALRIWNKIDSEIQRSQRNDVKPDSF